MDTGIGKKALSSFMAVVLAMGLSPTTALAKQQDADTGSAAGGKGGVLTAQADSDEEGALGASGGGSNETEIDSLMQERSITEVEFQFDPEGLEFAYKEGVVQVPEITSAVYPDTETGNYPVLDPVYYVVSYYDSESYEQSGTESEQCQPMEPGTYVLHIEGATPWTDYQDFYFSIVDSPLNTMALSESYPVSLEDGERWVGEFTAPTDGKYVFSSEGSDDTYGYLYADEGLTDLLASNDDGGEGANFKIVRTLSAGDTVFLMAAGYGGRAAECAVSVTQYDPNDFSNLDAELELSTHSFAAGWMPEGFVRGVRAYDEGEDEDYWLPADGYSVGYERWAYDGDGGSWQPAEGFDGTEPGEYRAVATGNAPYSGKLYASFDVSDYYSLKLWDPDVEAYAYIEGGAFHAPEFTLYRWVNDDERITLAQGDDFEVSGYERYDEEADEYVAVEGDPAVAGEYRAVLIPAEGSPYTGLAYMWFQVVDYSDLQNWDCGTKSSAYIEGDAFHAPEFYLYRWVNDDEQVTLAQGVDFEVSGYERYDEEAGEYVAVEGDPTEAGEYQAVLAPAAGSPYAGERRAWLQVTDYNDLSGWSVSRSGSAYVRDGSFHAPTFSVYRYMDGKDVYLEQGADFVVSGYERWDEGLGEYVAVDGEPAEAGYFYAVLAPAEGSAYTGELRIGLDVADYNDLSGWSVSRSGSAYVRDGSFHAPTFSVYRYMDGKDVYLEQGADFVVSGYERWDEGLGEYVAVDGEPAEAGRYRVVLAPAEGSPYIGERRAWLQVTDYDDLSGWDYEWSGSAYVRDGAFHAPTFGLYRWADGEQITLAQGADFVVSGYERYVDGEGYVAVDGEPTEAGEYQAVLVPAEGSPYTGERRIWLDVTDYNDLSGWDASSGSAYVRDGSFHAPTFILYRWVDGEDVYLEQGADFVVSGYERYVDGEGYVAIAGEPAEAGEYQAVLAPAAGSPYTGERRAWLQVADYNDLSGWNVGRSGSAYVRDGAFHAPTFSVYRYVDGEDVYLEQGADFVVSGYERYVDGEGYVAIDGEPAEAGRYRVVLAPAEGSPYIGERRSWFQVTDYNDLSGWDYNWSGSAYVQDGSFHAPTFGLYRWADGEQITLAQGADFVVSGYERYVDGEGYVVVDGEPAEAGEYRAVLVPAEGSAYTGECRIWLEIADYSNLRYWSVSRSGSAYVKDGAFHAPTFGLYRWADGEQITLVQGDDFVVSGYERYVSGEGYVAIAGEPAEAGEYQAVLAPVAGSPYMGECHAWLRVADYNDLSGWNCMWSGSAYIKDDSFHAPTFSLYRWADGEQITLVQGDDFVVSGYERYVSGEGYVAIAGEPAEAGEYQAVLAPAAGSPYTGERRQWLQITDYNDLSGWGYDWSGSAYVKDGSFHAPTFSLYRWVDDNTRIDLEQGADFVVSGYERYVSGESYVAIAGEPAEAGEYQAVLAPAAGSPYTGERRAWLQVADYNDLEGFNWSADSMAYVRDGVFSGQTYTLWRGDGDDRVTLVQGEHFVVAGYEILDGTGKNWVAVDKVTEPGYYRVTLSAVEGGGYSGNLVFSREVFAYNDLRLFNARPKTPAYLENDVYSNPEFVMFRIEDGATVELTQGVDFEVASYELWVEGEGYRKVDAPATAGAYRVTLTAIESGSYTGHGYAWVDVIDETSDEFDQAKANDVASQIDALGEITSLDQASAVEDARAAYDALTEAQKALVVDGMLSRLTKAEAAVAQLRADEEAADLPAYVKMLYREILGNDNPTDFQVDTWTGNIEGGQRIVDVVTQFTQSAAFANAGYTSEQKVRVLYAGMLGNQDPTDFQVSYWASKLDAGMPVEQIVDGFGQSAAFGTVCVSYGFGTDGKGVEPKGGVSDYVRMLYRELLDNDSPTDFQVNTWTSNINNGQRAVDVAVQFTQSAAFAGKGYTSDDKVRRLYAGILGNSDPTDFQVSYWASKLDSGTSLESVIDGFGQSAAFGVVRGLYGLTK